MPMLTEVSRKDADPFALEFYKALFGDRDPVAEPGTSTGTPGNWWTVFALSPAVLKHAVEGFRIYRPDASKLDPKLRELGQVRTGYARGSQFVFSQHCKAARNYGVTESQLEAIPHWQASDEFNALERAVLAFADGLVLEGGRVGKGVIAALKTKLGDQEILELAYVLCLYDMHATLSRALRLEYDDVPERIVEIPAPSGGSSDVMSMVDKD
jgi:alkylhydroperoxidase family enzyme